MFFSFSSKLLSSLVLGNESSNSKFAKHSSLLFINSYAFLSNRSFLKEKELVSFSSSLENLKLISNLGKGVVSCFTNFLLLSKSSIFTGSSLTLKLAVLFDPLFYHSF